MEKLLKRFELDLSENDTIEKTLIDNILERNMILNNLIKLLVNTRVNSIISIDADWGAGKTVFVKQLEYINKNKYDLNNFPDFDKETIDKYREECMVYYYNAWENDYHVDPIQSIIYKIINDYPEEKVETMKNDKKVPVLLNNVIKLSTVGVVDINEETTFIDLVEEIKTTEEIKESLNNIIENLICEKKEKMIVIVDELDRCNPNFAVRLIETIKQFYNNPNITFIVSTNNKELSKTIKRHYGESFDSYMYLNKIYDLIISLDQTSTDKYISNVLRLGGSHYYKEFIPRIFIENMNMSLRTANTYVSAIRVIEKFLDSSDPFFELEPFVKFYLVPYALALKITNIDKFNLFIKGDGGNELFDIIKSNSRMLTHINRIFANYIDDDKHVDAIVEAKDYYETFMKIRKNEHNKKFDISYKSKTDIIDILRLISSL